MNGSSLATGFKGFPFTVFVFPLSLGWPSFILTSVEMLSSPGNVHSAPPSLGSLFVSLRWPCLLFRVFVQRGASEKNPKNLPPAPR